jgi:hypothetical protein
MNIQGIAILQTLPNEIKLLDDGTIQIENLNIIDTLDAKNLISENQTSETVTSTDTLIHIGLNNPSNILDLGFFSEYNDGTTKYNGLIRDATDEEFYLFNNESVLPSESSNYSNRANLNIKDLETQHIHVKGFSTASIYLTDDSSTAPAILDDLSNGACELKKSRTNVGPVSIRLQATPSSIASESNIDIGKDVIAASTNLNLYNNSTLAMQLSANADSFINSSLSINKSSAPSTAIDVNGDITAKNLFLNDNIPTLLIKDDNSTIGISISDNSENDAEIRKRCSTGNSQLQLRPETLDGTGSNNIECFRSNTITTGSENFQIYKSSLPKIQFSTDGSFFGTSAIDDYKLAINKIIPTEALDIVGNALISGTVNTRDIAADGLFQDANLKLKNYTSVIAPTTSDDDLLGYSIGSQWVNTSDNKMYVCVDPSTSASIWTEITGGGGAGASIDDLTPSAISVYSSNKIISDAQELRTDIFNLAYTSRNVLYYGSNGLSQNSTEQDVMSSHDDIAGNILSGSGVADVFTLGSGSFNVHLLLGYSCYSFISTSAQHGIWGRVITNGSLSLTVESGKMFPNATRIIIQQWNPIYKTLQNTYTGVNIGYTDSITDGNFVYFFNSDAVNFQKYNIVDNTAVNVPITGKYFSGCLAQNKCIYAPRFDIVDRFMIYDTNSGVSFEKPFLTTPTGYRIGALEVGDFIYFLARDPGAHTVKYNKLTQQNINIINPSTSNNYGGCFDGRYIYFCPVGLGDYYRLDTTNDQMQQIGLFTSGNLQVGSGVGCLYSHVDRCIYYGLNSLGCIACYDILEGVFHLIGPVDTQYIGLYRGITQVGENIYGGSYTSHYNFIFNIKNAQFRFYFVGNVVNSGANPRMFNSVSFNGRFLIYCSSGQGPHWLQLPIGSAQDTLNTISGVNSSGPIYTTSDLIIRAPNLSRYALRVDNSGVLSANLIT